VSFEVKENDWVQMDATGTKKLNMNNSFGSSRRQAHFFRDGLTCVSETKLDYLTTVKLANSSR